MKGVIILASHKSSNGPLSYGIGNEPDPEMLLLRNRATVFSDRKSAKKALAETMRLADHHGHTWHTIYNYRIVELT